MRQQVGRERRDEAEPQGSGKGVEMILGCRNEVLDRAQHAAGLIEDRPAGIGQSQPASRSLEQNHPEFAFQFGELGTERGLGYSAGLSRPGDAPMALNGDDVGEVSNVHIE